MRPLRFNRQHTPATETAAAEAWQVLQALPLPVDLPEFAREAFSERGLRFILSVARQYPDCGFTCFELAAAGHAAAVAAAVQKQAQPVLWQRFGAWWVRQGILVVAGRGLEFSS